MAVPNDKASIMRMIGEYRMVSPLEFHKTSSLGHADKIVDIILEGAGFCLVSEDVDGIHGMLLAFYNPNIWNPEKMALHEAAYWVDPDYRGGRSGYRLIKSYVEEGKRLQAEGKIEYFTISKMINSPDLDYGRFGFSKLEEMWEQ
jgi:GNAT superfamily N-acetyltransferase